MHLKTSDRLKSSNQTTMFKAASRRWNFSHMHKHTVCRWSKNECQGPIKHSVEFSCLFHSDFIHMSIQASLLLVQLCGNMLYVEITIKDKEQKSSLCYMKVKQYKMWMSGCSPCMWAEQGRIRNMNLAEKGEA